MFWGANVKWNYRVMRHIDGEAVWYGVHEVYYDEKGEELSWTAASLDRLYSESVEDLQDMLDKMLMATSKPVLEYSKINKVTN